MNQTIPAGFAFGSRTSVALIRALRIYKDSPSHGIPAVGGTERRHRSEGAPGAVTSQAGKLRPAPTVSCLPLGLFLWRTQYMVQPSSHQPALPTHLLFLGGQHVICRLRV